MVVRRSQHESRREGVSRAAWITAWATVFASLITSVTAYVTLRGPDTAKVITGPGGAPPSAPTCSPPGIISAKPKVVTENPVKFQSVVRGDVYTLTSASYDMGGLFIDLSALTCNYQMDFDAELVAASDDGENTGWGYQIGPCNTWDGKTPRGFTFGFAFFQGAGNASAADNSSWGLAESPVGVRVAVGADYHSHHWTVQVTDTSALLVKDLGLPYGPYPLTRDDKTEGPSNIKQRLPTNCRDSGVFIRVFNSQARFSNLEVRAVKT